MRTTRMYLVAMAALTIAASGVAARADDKSDINALYGKLANAFKTKNMKAIGDLGTPDFTSKMPGGQTMDRKTSLSSMEEGFKPLTMKKVVMKPDKITVNGKSAVIMGHYSFKATMQGPKGKTQVMTDQGTSKDVLAKTSKGWLFKSTETLTSNPKLDGKPVSMGGPPPTKK